MGVFRKGGVAIKNIVNKKNNDGQIQTAEVELQWMLR
jgi:hypothetical protein